MKEIIAIFSRGGGEELLGGNFSLTATEPEHLKKQYSVKESISRQTARFTCRKYKITVKFFQFIQSFAFKTALAK